MEPKLIKALRSDASFIAFSLLLGFALRLLHLEGLSESPLLPLALGTDASEYAQWARSILSGQLLWTQVQIHAPLYPLFLAGIYKTFGCDLVLVRLLQMSLGLLAGIPLFLMLRDAVAKAPVHFRAAPRLFLFLWAVFPLGIQCQSEICSEALMLPLLIASAWLLHEAEKPRGLKISLSLMAGAGLFAGLAVVTHPGSIFFILLEGAWLLWKALKERRGLLGFAPLLLFGLLSLAPILPVSLYNSHLAKRPCFVQANGGFNFYLGCNEDANGGCYLRPGPDWDSCHASAQAEAARLGVSTDTVFFGRAFSWASSHPFDWLALSCKKALLAINARELPTSTDFSLSSPSFIQRHFWLLFGPFAVLALLGLWLELRKKGGVLPSIKHFLILGLAFWTLQIVFVAGGRYRIPMHPALLALSAFAILSLIGILAARKRSLEILAVVIAASLLVYAPNPRLDIKALRGEADSTLAEAWLQAGSPSKALALLESSGDLPDWDRTLNLKGRILEALGRRAEARQAYERAIERFESSHYAFMNLAAMLSDSGELAKAKGYFEAAFARNSDDPDLLYNMALFEQRSGSAANAMELYARCLALNPAHRKALNNLGALKLMAGDAKVAAELFAKALALEPGNASLMVNLAAAKLSSGDKPGAKRLLERAKAIDPSGKAANELLKGL